MKNGESGCRRHQLTLRLRQGRKHPQSQKRRPIPSPNEYGGPTDQGFRYDDLYRLTDAQGLYQFARSKQDIYSLSMSYDSIHNILNKNQEQMVVQPSGALVTQKKTSYNWNYAYNNQQPHAAVHIGERTYSYDANGNQTGWTSDVNGTRRNIVWDEENRIQSIFDNGHQKEYVYNDAGDRVLKRGPQGETVYVNQFYVVRNRSIATKQIYAGNSRIASRMITGNSGTTNTISASAGAVKATGNGKPGNADNFLYFYHPDHLGSTGYVTDVNGKLYEHIEYFPFGETWVEEHSNTQRTPYLFTGKELDEETGLYYFGARYYDPRTSVWQSADPILGEYLPTGDKDKKLPGGGVYNPINLSAYTYAGLNPLNFVDPDGNFFVAMEFYRKTSNGSPDWQRIRRYQFYEGSVGATAAIGDAILLGTIAGAAAPEAALQFAVRFPKTTTFTTYLIAGLAGVPLPGAAVMPQLGSKLEYFLGRATGSAHNVERSKQMLSQLERIGLPDTPATRQFLKEHLAKVLNDPSSMAHMQKNGRAVRDSLLVGPEGFVKFETVWEGTKLITGNIFGIGRPK